MAKTSLADRTCVPCRGGVPPLKGKNLKEIHQQLADPAQWKIVNDHHLVRACKFPDFKSALGFVNRVGEVAEAQGHHPDILLHGWNKVRLALSSHSAGGLTAADFDMARRFDGLG